MSKSSNAQKIPCLLDWIKINVKPKLKKVMETRNENIPERTFRTLTH